MFTPSPILPVLRNYPLIELHSFHSSETASTNPFIEEMEKAGSEISLTNGDEQ